MKHLLFLAAHRRLPQLLPQLLPQFLPRLLMLSLATISAGCSATNSSNAGDHTTARLADATVTIYAAGDIAECHNVAAKESMAARTADLIAAALADDRTAVALTLGDNAYPNGSATDYENCYDPTWGRFKQRTLPSPGNHEYHTPAATAYYEYFGALAGPPHRGYYSAAVGTWHVISLNSNLIGDDQKAQLDWLKADLAAHRGGCKLAFWHHPVYSSGSHGNNGVMRDAWRLLAAAGTDLVLSGHDHDYERFAPQDVDGNIDIEHGIRQFVVGGGGAGLTKMRSRRAHSETVDNLSHGVIKLQLLPASYVWNYLAVGDSAQADRGSADCHR